MTQHQNTQQNHYPATEPFPHVPNEVRYDNHDAAGPIDVSGVAAMVQEHALRSQPDDLPQAPRLMDTQQMTRVPAYEQTHVYEQPIPSTPSAWERVKAHAKDRTTQYAVGALIVATAAVGGGAALIESAQSNPQAATEQDAGGNQPSQKTLIAKIPKTSAPVEHAHFSAAARPAPSHDRTRPAPTTTTKPPVTTTKSPEAPPVVDPPKLPKPPVEVTPPNSGEGVVDHPLVPYQPEPITTTTAAPAAPLNP
jgi:hypothetical protein